jgi:hypothetical protein
VEQQVEANTRVIHVFDREGDLAEVFDQVRQLQHTGVVVRAAHNRSLDQNSERLWSLMEFLPIRFEQDISVQLEVLKAQGNQKLPSLFTVAWAVEAVAYLGGYLEHRRQTPIGIQVLWRGWLKLHDLCEGWELARNT